MRNPISVPAVFTACCFLFLVGCGSTKPAKFYALSPMSTGMNQATTHGGAVSVRLDPVKIPDYLDRPQIVLRSGRNELVVSEYNRWAGSLPDDFARVLAENLMTLLAGDNVAVTTQRRISSDYRLNVDVLLFDIMPDGLVQLRASWSLSGKDEVMVVPMHPVAVDEMVEGTDYSARVNAMSRALEKLGRDMAEVIKPLINNKK